MTTRRRAAAFVLSAFVVVSGIGCQREGSATARVSMIRLQHEVRPAGYQPRIGPNGEPQLALDVLVVNRGREKLDSLTLLVTIVGPDANDRTSKRVTLDTAGLIPGVSGQLSAVVEGLEVRDGETVLVELEATPPERELSQFPEYSQGVN